MRRAPFVLAATVAGLVAVLDFHSKGTSNTVLTGGGPGGAGATAGQGSSGAGAGTGTSSGPSTPSGSGASAGGATTTTTAPSTASGTATGALEQYGYGELSVRVTVSGGKITTLSTPTLRTAESYSQQLAVQAIPMLRSEVLKAQTAKIYGITGATYTSEAYAASVQSALDKLHFK